MLNPITLPSYAKINLFLDILGVREDGYHLLTMVNAKISLHDLLTCTVDRSETIRVSGNHSSVPFGRDNTAYQAADLFFKQTHTKWGCTIFIEKRIPIGAGLGGGSSNAATVLNILNTLAEPPINHELLLEIGAAIGADVPFFLHERCCSVRGIGERVLELYIPNTKKHALPMIVLCSPPVSVSTAKAYALWDQQKKKIHRSPTDLISALSEGRFFEISNHLFNAFEPAVFSAFPEIKQAYDIFTSISPTRPLLSGSGSNLFSVISDPETANEVSDRLRERGYPSSVWELML